MTNVLQVAAFVSEVDALHSELEKLESSARVSLLPHSLFACHNVSDGNFL